jgi:hypothetical protein
VSPARLNRPQADTAGPTAPSERVCRGSPLAIDAVANRMVVQFGIEALMTSPDMGLVEKAPQ